MKQQIYKAKNSNKILYLMRGLTGSGKSTLAKQLSKNIYSTDDFFTKKNKYKYNINKRGEAHKWNKKRVEESMKKGLNPLVVDNTHKEAWELKPYVKMGIKFNYNIFLIEPDTEYKFNPKELAKKTTHNLSEEIIKWHLTLFEKNLTLKKILNSTSPEEN